tara:strand:+ start:125 stop:328 length:204 start_codon:yes stop_codon:yes gene_type:complete
MAPFSTICCFLLCWLSWKLIVLPKYQEQDDAWGEEYRKQNLAAKERAALFTILFWTVALGAILFVIE